MAKNRKVLLVILGALILSACKTPTPPNGESISGEKAGQTSGNAAQQNPEGGQLQQTGKSAQQELSVAVASYENESLKSSEKELLSALKSDLLSKHDQVIAHKYLAFIYCTSHRKKLCRNEFRKALKIDPAFDLTPAEAGHPIWGPIFRVVKGKDGK